ncbi:MAG TPA: DNA primase [Candidatus Eremiobacteraceae bacterium]|nr:DNA primase [Candidatus Eremiobacteraceae bacterium]
MPFDAGVVSQIQAKVDLLAYVSQYVTLKKRGREYLGLCPFHAEKTPSFSLNADKQLWHCYGCDAGGDLIKFVQRYENVDFPTAVRMLAQRAGISLEETPGAARRRSEREAIYEANAAAQRFFETSLRRNSSAQAYLKKRGIDDATARAFGIGYAPDAWDELGKSLAKSSIEPPVAHAAGLVRQRERGDGYYDFFRNRLMLPIYNLTGEVMAFGGRALDDEQPKYLNTPSTSAYAKGKHVYALNVARRAASADGALIVVEGYLDAIALHQAGFANAVASLGTAFTPEQARELRRVASNLYLCFDGDTAGQAATARSIDMLVEEGLAVRVVTLPAGTDPDEVVLGGGREAIQALLDASTPWVDFKIDITCRRIAARFANKGEIAREALAVIAHVRDPIERDQYVKAMARRLDIDEGALRRAKYTPAASAAVTGARRDADAPIVRAPHTTRPEPPSIERDLLQIVLSRPVFLGVVAARVTPDDLEDDRFREVFEQLLAHRDEVERGLNPVSVLSENEGSGEFAKLALSAPTMSVEEDERRLARVLERFDRRRAERRLSSVDAEMNVLLTEGRAVPSALRDEYNALAVRLFGLDAVGKGVS